jgi:hypothetical protein
MGPSPVLSGMVSRALAQSSSASSAPAPKTPLPLTISLVASAGLGLAASLIPERKKTIRKVAMGGSLVSLLVAAALFSFGD